MVSSWKQFWASEERIALILCLLGIAFGLTIGNFIKDWAESFHSIEIFSYQIPLLISFGTVVGLDVRIISVVAIWTVLRGGLTTYDRSQ
jgi:hypothetical protein